ncbi:MAG: bifunctional aldolase/short-chain dehydrogenase [Gemmatimonadaceae bacterium]|nr:bifunctional aldolase/short-chain dehydrogenase [Gemmatimonadaceae bacterium]
MRSLWSDNDAGKFNGDPLALRVYTSRLLGSEPALVLHGGGNTSVKVTTRDIFGDEEDILYVKGSGWDLATIEEAGFAPVRLSHLKRLAGLEFLSDPEMVNEFQTQTTRPGAPTPSVEAILHAVLPYKFVDHTHADAVVTLTNSANGRSRIDEVYGNVAVIIPYVMPGFPLAQLCGERFAREAGPATIGMVLMNHGIFSFGESAYESYERMISLVDRAEQYLKRNKAWGVEWDPPRQPAAKGCSELPRLRREISDAAGFPLIVWRQSDDRSLSFAQCKDLEAIATHGPATPDHVLRTKRLPMIGRDVAKYVDEYRDYFVRNGGGATGKVMVDPAPRVILDPTLGMCTVGRSAADAGVVADIYSHTIDIITRASALGGYTALPEREIFDVEYWDLEQAKLAKSGERKVFSGEIALITGAASGIGRACVDSFLRRDASVVGVDINPKISTLYQRPDFSGIQCDITAELEVAAALERTVNCYGGLDMLVLNAGIFPASRPIAELPSEEWSKVMRLNLDANLTLMRLAFPLLKLAPRGGRVVIIGSRNVAAPGPGAAAYSASKAGLNQLARVAALEWGGDGIRVNSLHPHGVFDTGIWTDEVLRSRALLYGLTVEEYRKNNVLKTEITSRDVAELAAELCGPVFAKTTGAHIPVDGGNDRVI